jgi:hypothetical protein
MSPDEGQKEMEEVEEELSEHDAKAKKDGDLMEEGRPSVSATYLLTHFHFRLIFFLVIHVLIAILRCLVQSS